MPGRVACPYGTDIEGQDLQRQCQSRYRRHPNKPLFEVAPFAMGAGFADATGHDPTCNARKDEYAVIAPAVGDAPNDSLSFFMENMRAYDDHKVRTNKTEAAVTIFPLGMPPKTRQKKKRAAPPLTDDEKYEARNCYDASHLQYDNMRRHARDDHVKQVAHVDALPGAAKCGADPLTAQQTVDCYGYALSKREGLKKSNQLSDDTRAAIFGY
ncbi:oxidoreductase [Aureococcus anophagefferens]|nr:oxidoreductase [Aureococcus anophagefferens]